MSKAREPFGQALSDLRQRALSGVYGPGGAVVIVEEAERLGLSTTPVREALAWLGGEGLMERTPRAGYCAPRLDAPLLRDRFWLRLRSLTTSLELTADLPLSATPPADGLDAVDELFDRLVRATGNRALVDAFRRVQGQLRMLGEAEARVFGDWEDEAAELIRVGKSGSRAALAASLEAYHHRRIDAAAMLVLDVERRGSRSPEDDAP